jgi:hypothetical protein
MRFEKTGSNATLKPAIGLEKAQESVIMGKKV